MGCEYLSGASMEDIHRCVLMDHHGCWFVEGFGKMDHHGCWFVEGFGTNGSSRMLVHRRI